MEPADYMATDGVPALLNKVANMKMVCMVDDISVVDLPAISLSIQNASISSS